MMKRKSEAFIIVITSLGTNKITVNLDMPVQIETRPNGDIVITGGLRCRIIVQPNKPNNHDWFKVLAITMA